MLAATVLGSKNPWTIIQHSGLTFGTRLHCEVASGLKRPYSIQQELCLSGDAESTDSRDQNQNIWRSGTQYIVKSYNSFFEQRNIVNLKLSVTFFFFFYLVKDCLIVLNTTWPCCNNVTELIWSRRWKSGSIAKRVWYRDHWDVKTEKVHSLNLLR